MVRPRLRAWRGVEPEICPQRRAHESHVIDVDDARVEQLDPVVSALARELEPCGVDFRAVPLVVAGHVQEVGIAPSAHHLADAVRAHRGRDRLRGRRRPRRGNRGEGVAPELDVEVGEICTRMSGGGFYCVSCFQGAKSRAIRSDALRAT